MNAKRVTFLLLTILAFAIPLTVFVANQRQDIRQRAHEHHRRGRDGDDRDRNDNEDSNNTNPTPNSGSQAADTTTSQAPSNQILSADVDRDGCVGIGDYNSWLSAFQGHLLSGTFPDINGDVKVDLLDYRAWFQAMQTLPPAKLC